VDDLNEKTNGLQQWLLIGHSYIHGTESYEPVY